MGDKLFTDAFEPGSIDAASVYSAQTWTVAGETIWLLATRCSYGTGDETFGQLVLMRARKGAVPRLKWISFEKSNGELLGPLLGIHDARRLLADISHERYLLLATEGKSRVAIYDLMEDRLIEVLSLPAARRVASEEAIQSVFLSLDRHYLIQLNANGKLVVHSLAQGQPILWGRFIDDEIVLHDDNGYYDGTAEGAHFVFLRFPGVPGYHSFHQFRQTLNRPDYIRSLIRGEPVTLHVARLAPPPTIDTRLVSATLRGGVRKVELAVDAIDSSELKLLRLYGDGKLIKEVTLEAGKQIPSLQFELAAQLKWLTAQAVDSHGNESVPVALALKGNQNTRGGRLVGLSIGTDTYTDPQLANLRLAREDAHNFAAALRSLPSGYYSSVEMQELLDTPNLKSEIIERVRKIVKLVTREDTILLFAAGHGLQNALGNFFLATVETRIANLEQTAVAWDELAEVLKGSNARVIVFLDACHSGAAGQEATNDAAVARLLSKGSIITVLAASKGRQFSHERSELKGGVFTATIVRLLTAERISLDTNRNGVIELSELYGHLKRRVVEMTNGEQTPWIARNEMVGEIPLF